MNHCQEYWKLAEQVSHAFQLAEQAASSSVTAPGCDTDQAKALHSSYLSAIKRLDEHAMNCPCCQGRR